MNQFLRIFFIFTIILALFACASPMKEGQDILQPSRNEPLHLMKLSSNGLTDQQPAIQAKHFLSERDEISRVRAVNYEDDLIVAIDVHHLKRLQLKKIKADVQKEIDEQFSNLKVTLSTDQKILLELKDLEEAIEANEMNEEELQKKINDIKQLSNEET